MPPPSPASRRRISGETVLFWLLLALHLAPIWILPFIPTQDGPGHQALAFILRLRETLRQFGEGYELVRVSRDGRVRLFRAR